MLMITCNCLNVKLHTKQQEVSYSVQQDIFKEPVKDQFFQEKLGVIKICEPGITQEHSYLIHKRQDGGWTVYHCLNCGIDTYATHKERPQLALISHLLQSDALVVERLKTSSEFSKAFRILLKPSSTDYFVSQMPDPSSKHFESLQCNINNIQQHLSTFLLNEESLMENRIRQFEDEEREKFQKLQAKVKADKKKMVNLLVTINDANSESYKNKSPVKLNQGSGDTELPSVKQTKKVAIPDRKSPLTRTKSSPVSKPPERSLDSEAMFLLDESDAISEEPYYSSDEDETEDDGDDHKTPVHGRRISLQKRDIYSSSVPISVPGWNQVDNSPTEEQIIPSHPDQIAASMQALAQSITNDERYIFGDRPRPRLNTNDFKNPFK